MTYASLMTIRAQEVAVATEEKKNVPFPAPLPQISDVQHWLSSILQADIYMYMNDCAGDMISKSISLS